MKPVILIGAVVLLFCLVTGSVTMSDDDDQEKIIWIILGIHKDGVALESVEIRYGHAPNLGYQNGNFTATILAPNGTHLFSFDVWDPRSQVEAYGFRNELERHEQMENSSLEQGYKDLGERDDIDLPLIIPYHQDIRTVSLAEKESGALLISVNVSPAVDTFRSRFPKDPDMIEGHSTVTKSLLRQMMGTWPF
ncbi:hypothetical protein [Methanoregula sp.]|uniref:hypothetical protein n=1 Tax=Methanoregula sp. TaxID=2052170 RepID=UPI00236B6547|nr:hypothetical protein [Methanoregula sp.]MDD1687524.1 hypothetical protein [Methanoregula sp.]